MPRRIVRILVAAAIPHLPHETRHGVAQVLRHRVVASGVDVLARPAQGDVGAVRLGRGGEVHRGLGEGDGALRQPDEMDGLLGGHGYRQGHRVRHADVLRGQDDDAARDEHRVLAGLQHPGEPVDARIGVRASHGLDEGGDGVVVLVARLVVQKGALLEGLFQGGEGDSAGALCVRLRGRDGELQAVEGDAGVAVRHGDEVAHGLGRQLRAQLAEAAVGVRQGALDDDAELVVLELSQGEDAGAGEQGRDDLERRDSPSSRRRRRLCRSRHGGG